MQELLIAFAVIFCVCSFFLLEDAFRQNKSFRHAIKSLGIALAVCLVFAAILLVCLAMSLFLEFQQWICDKTGMPTILVILMPIILVATLTGIGTIVRRFRIRS